MRFARLEPVTDVVINMQAVYGPFDLGLDGRPSRLWEGRNIKKFRPPEMMQHAFFPDVYLARIAVNRRILGALERVYQEIGACWTREARAAHGLNQYVKCYCFGEGSAPNLFWYGGAWELSVQVVGETLSKADEIFARHGFKRNPKRLRTFEYW